MLCLINPLHSEELFASKVVAHSSAGAARASHACRPTNTLTGLSAIGLAHLPCMIFFNFSLFSKIAKIHPIALSLGN
jgi:hypothetical protein